MDRNSRPLSGLLHHAIATGDIEKLHELLKVGACVNTPLYINEHMVEAAKRRSKTNSIASRLSSTSLLEPINESTPSKPLIEKMIVERQNLDISIEDSGNKVEAQHVNETMHESTDENKGDKGIITDKVENEDILFTKENTVENKKNNIELKADDSTLNSDKTKSKVVTNDHNKDLTEQQKDEHLVLEYATEETKIQNGECEETVVDTDDSKYATDETKIQNGGCEETVVDTDDSKYATDDTKIQNGECEETVVNIDDSKQAEDVNNEIRFQENTQEDTHGESSNTQEDTQGESSGMESKETQKQDQENKTKETKDYEATPTTPEETSTGNENIVDDDENDGKESDYEEPVKEEIEAIMKNMEELRKGENNNRKSVADTIDEKLNDENEILIERHASIQKKTDEADRSPLKLLPRIKRKISIKWRSKHKKSEREDEEEDDMEEFYENVPTLRNVDNEQLNENYEGIAFFEAVREGMDMIVQTLLETSNNYQLDTPDENGFTPAMQAAWHGQNECLQILLDHGADIQQPNATGCTPAHFAAGQGHYDCLEMILKFTEPDTVDTKTKFGATPLILSSKGGHKECIELLLNHGADPNIQYRGNQNSLLFAAGNGHYECIQALLEYKVDIDQANSQNVTPLMRVVQQGHNACVVLLIDHGANIDLQDSIGRTAVHFAVEHKNPKALKLLIEANAGLYFKTKGGSTPVTYAERFQSRKCAELLENRINDLKEKEQVEEKESEIVTKTEERTPTCGVFKNIFRRKKRNVEHE